MKILAVDTSSELVGCAVVEDGKILGEIQGTFRKGHSSILLPLISALLEDTGVDIKEVDALAISEGPGSFTGLRIGFTAVKTLAYTFSLPLAGVPSLDVIAYNAVAFTEGKIVVLADARKDNLYGAVYESCGKKLKRKTKYFLKKVDEALSEVENICKEDKKIYFIGDALGIYDKIIKKRFGKRCIFAPEQLQAPKVSSVARLAVDKLKKNRLLDIFKSSPMYLYGRYCNVRTKK